jgi:hypothetical protein
MKSYVRWKIRKKVVLQYILFYRKIKKYIVILKLNLEYTFEFIGIDEKKLFCSRGKAKSDFITYCADFYNYINYVRPTTTGFNICKLKQ